VLDGLWRGFEGEVGYRQVCEIVGEDSVAVPDAGGLRVPD
jgi:hypothetical protein